MSFRSLYLLGTIFLLSFIHFSIGSPSQAGRWESETEEFVKERRGILEAEKEEDLSLLPELEDVESLFNTLNLEDNTATENYGNALVTNLESEDAAASVENSDGIEDVNKIFTIFAGEDEEESDAVELEVPYQGEESRSCGRKKVRTTEGLLRVIGGRYAQPGSIPWQVALLDYKQDNFCGGTLISNQWVLTAAHCVQKKIYVRLGEHDMRFPDTSEEQIKVSKIYAHPDYDKDEFHNDVALLKLSRPVRYNDYIQPACLPSRLSSPPAKGNCVISGWGKVGKIIDYGSTVLKYARVPVVKKAECRKAYPDRTLTSSQFCAGFKRGSKDACAGDSGGPLMCENAQGEWTLHGVVSFGMPCGSRGRYGVYSKVAKFIPWIGTVTYSD